MGEMFIDYAKINRRDGTSYDTAAEPETILIRNGSWKPANVISFSEQGGIDFGYGWGEEKAHINGWILNPDEDPLKCPVLHTARGWVMLDDEYHITAASPTLVLDWLESHALL
jgi:hypothetical protein